MFISVVFLHITSLTSNSSYITLVNTLPITNVNKNAKKLSSKYVTLSNSKNWYENAIKEAPYLRESYVELANLYYNNKNYQKAIELLDKAFLIKEKSESYINEDFAWNGFIYDLYSICAFYLHKNHISFWKNKLHYVIISLNMKI